MKTNKTEPFDLNRLIADFQNGSLESVVAKPDFCAAHQPHVDLTVRPRGSETHKYRIYDGHGAMSLRDNFGSGGLDLRR